MKATFLIVCFCFVSFISLAQGGGPVPDPAPAGGGGGVPIDGGIGWLAAAGVAYGVKKLRDRNKNK
jgi:hypothetical protein